MAGGGGDQVVGFRYYMGLHMAICYGPVDSINQVFISERPIDPDLNTFPVTTTSTVTLDNTSLFGGDEKEGGIFGDCDFEFGGGAQVKNAYLISQLGANVPAFRGVTCAVFHSSAALNQGVYESPTTGGYLTAITPYPKPWAFDVTDIPGGSFNVPAQNINGGSANGGHVIYDCIIDTDWGMGRPAGDIDAASFTAVTNALFAESFGLSLTYGTQSPVEEFIREILNHINAVLYTDRQTNQFVLKLIRDDFDPLTLPIFDETNIASLVSFERPSYAEMTNEVVLKYRVRGTLSDTAITVQDLASAEAQGGLVSQTISMTGIDNSDIAARVAQRELRQLSTPLARIRFIANREAWEVNPGDVIKLSWGAYGISEMILRVVQVDYGTLESGLVGIDAVEDIFGLPSASYFIPQGTGWVEPVQPPMPADSQIVVELPYFVARTQFSEIAITSETAVLQLCSENPVAPVANLRLNTRIAPADYVEVAAGDMTPTMVITAGIDALVTTGVVINTPKGAIGAIVIGGYAYLNDEILRIDAVDIGAGTINIGRGYLDSVPLAHLAGSIIYFADRNSAIDPTIYDSFDTVQARGLTETTLGVLPLLSAPELTLVMTDRMDRPYNAAQVRVAGSFNPPPLVDAIVVPITWTHQDRTQQLALAGADWYNIALGSPEAGVTYRIRIFNDDTSALLNTTSGINGTSFSYNPPVAVGVTVNLRVEINSERGGLSSRTTYSHIFSFTKGEGFRFLENEIDDRGLTNGDQRITE